MGIKNLMSLIEKKASGAILHKDLEEYNGDTIVIDASYTLYKGVIAIRNSGIDMRDKDNQETTHLKVLFDNIILLMRHGIRPIYVFDGKPPSLKKTVLKKRREKRCKSIEKLESEELSDEERSKHYAKTFCIRSNHIRECQQLLDLMGIPWVMSKGEADPQCAVMVLVDQYRIFGAVSDDTDLLTFGVPRLLRGMSAKSKTTEINLAKVLEGLGLSYNQFVDLCILMGTGLCPTLGGIGKIKAYEGLKEHGTLESFLESVKDNPKVKVPSDFMEMRNKLKSNYLNAQVILPEKHDIKPKGINREEVVSFMCDGKDFNRTLINNALKKLKWSLRQLNGGHRYKSTKRSCGETLPFRRNSRKINKNKKRRRNSNYDSDSSNSNNTDKENDEVTNKGDSMDVDVKKDKPKQKSKPKRKHSNNNKKNNSEYSVKKQTYDKKIQVPPNMGNNKVYALSCGYYERIKNNNLRVDVMVV
jgi:flap endonuclease-1